MSAAANEAFKMSDRMTAVDRKCGKRLTELRLSEREREGQVALNAEVKGAPKTEEKRNEEEEEVGGGIRERGRLHVVTYNAPFAA